MPVLSFPCVVTARDGATPTCSRRIWIKGHDLAALARAATEQLGASLDACGYLLFSLIISLVVNVVNRRMQLVTQ